MASSKVINPSVDKISQTKILVIGDVMLDVTHVGHVQRISPEAPVPVLELHQVKKYLGGAGNVAKNLASLGASVTLIGSVGRDQPGKNIISLCAQSSIQFIPIFHHGPTTVKERFTTTQQLLRVDREEKISVQEHQLVSAIQSTIAKVDAVIISDYGKGVCDNLKAVIALARKKSIPIFADPKGNSFKKYYGASYLTPNLKEFETVYGPSSNEQGLLTKAKKTVLQLSIQGVVITRSEKGVTVCTKNNNFSIPANAKEVFDVSGAGDTFIAFFALCLTIGYPLSDSIAIANSAAGMVVGKRGVVSLSMAEALPLFFTGQSNKTITLEQARMLAKCFKQLGKKIGFTNGCFDLLHSGHVFSLQYAKKHSDVLFVGINDDGSIRMNKGPTRPILTLQDRIPVIASLSVVDFVIPFSDRTPLKIINAIKPDILFKGSDYTEANVVGASQVRRWGGQVSIVPLQKGKSTSEIVKKIISIH